MSVHQDISEHSRKQHQHLQRFQELDEERERYIEEAILACLEDRPFSVEGINEITRYINEHAKQGISPLRKYVTVEMIREYASKLRSQS